MQYQVRSLAELFQQPIECVLVGIFKNGKMPKRTKQVDDLLGGIISRMVASCDADAELGSVAKTLNEHEGQFQRIVIVGLGKHKDFSAKHLLKAQKAGWAALKGTRATSVIWTLHEALEKEHDIGWGTKQAIIQHNRSVYKCISLSKQHIDDDEVASSKLQSVAFTYDPDEISTLYCLLSAINRGNAISSGIKYAKDLGNLPGNVCTPSYLAESARALATTNDKFEVEVLEREKCQELRMGSFLAVAQGSDQPPKFIVLKYNGAAGDKPPIVLVGKGITFDSGGISLKPGSAMDEMKFDMCGAASVLGTLKAVSELQLEQNVYGIIPTCENMPNGNAVKPGDVVTSMSGKTIEVLNTDAEGRLVLCDALTYVERFTPAPAVVIDVATLTGAIVVALGSVHSGMFTKDVDLAHALLQAASDAADSVWHMPLDDEYQEQLTSNFADVANIGGREAGSVTAACFLARFAEKFNWAHLDIAGTASVGGAAKGATGRPVSLLTHFIMHSS